MRFGRAGARAAFAVLRALDALELALVAHAAFAALAVLRAFDASTGRHVAEQAAGAIGVRTATRNHYASMRHGRGVAGLAHSTIAVLVADALIGRRVAIRAAAFGAVRARFAQFLGAKCTATIARHRIAIIAAFIGFEDAVTATSHDTGIRIRRRIADFAACAIHVIVARTNIHVTQPARARCARGASFAKLDQTSAVTTIIVGGIAVVAAFIGFDAAITTRERNADVRIGRRIARRSAGTIRVLITSAHVAIGIAESALAIARRHVAGLSEFEQTRRAATIARRRIAVVAPFGRFDHRVSAARIHADVRHCGRIANLTRRTIRFGIASAGVIGRITETAGARRRTTRAGQTNFQQAHVVAAVITRQVAVVATFAHFEDAIAATLVDALMRARKDAA